MKNVELIREAISKELETKNNRINWLLISQSFIFVAFGVIQKSLGNVGSGELNAVIPLIPYFGVFISLLTLFGISGCYRAIYILYSKYVQAVPSMKGEDVEPSTFEYLIFKDWSSKWIGIIYSYALCLGILSFWLYAYKILVFA